MREILVGTESGVWFPDELGEFSARPLFFPLAIVQGGRSGQDEGVEGVDNVDRIDPGYCRRCLNRAGVWGRVAESLLWLVLTLKVSNESPLELEWALGYNLHAIGTGASIEILHKIKQGPGKDQCEQTTIKTYCQVAVELHQAMVNIIRV